MEHTDAIAAALGMTPSAAVNDCENCYDEHTADELKQFDPCAVKTLLSWAINYSQLSPEEALKLMPQICPDVLWDRIDALLDDLKSGVFNYEE